MVPARTTSPVWRFTPRRFAFESRPLRELPPPFLCAIAWVLLCFGGPCSLRSCRLCGGFTGSGLLSLSRNRLLHRELGDGDLDFDGLGFSDDRHGFLCDRLRLRLLRCRRALGRGRFGLCFGLAASDLVD